MNLFYGDPDPAMRYEGLMRAIFYCDKFNDPWRYAAQEFYNEFTDIPTLLGKRAISTALIKMVLDYPNSEKVEAIKDLEKRVWNAESQVDIINIIDEATEIAIALNY